MKSFKTFQENFRGKKLLVTGASGYLAWNLMRTLSEVDCEIHRVSRSLQQTPRELGQPSQPGEQRRAQLIDHLVDIRSLESWDSLIEGIDTIFHFSAQTSVYTANADPVLDWSQNVLPLLQLLETCRKAKKSPFILFSGSATQCGIPKTNPVDENHLNDPVTAYCLHKLMAEQYLELYSRQNWAKGACLRLSNVYGPGPKSSSADRGVLNQVMMKGLRYEPITIYGQGDQIRDYIYINDVIQAFLAVGSHSEQTNGHHFILSSGIGTSLSEAFHLVADRIALKSGKKPEVLHIAPPAGSSAVDSRHFVGNISKIKSMSGWAPRFSLTEGIDETLNYFMKGE